MLEWFYPVIIGAVTALGFLLVGLGLVGRPPSGFSLLLIATVEFLLLMQLVSTITITVLGERAATSTIEFYGYLITALIVPPAATVWALLERSRWSTVVLGAGALTVSVMLVRMQQIWTGVLPL